MSLVWRSAGKRVSLLRPGPRRAARRSRPPPMMGPGLPISISATIRKAAMRNAGGMCMAVGGSSIACAIPLPIGSPPLIGRAASRHDTSLSYRRRRAHRPRPRHPLQLRRPAVSRVSPAIHWPRPCWRTTCTWLAARSNIIGREASCLPALRNPMRWSRSIAARAGSRRTCGPRRSNCTTAWSPAARTAIPRFASIWVRWRASPRRCCPPASTTRHSCGRRRSGVVCMSRRSGAPRG